MRHHSALEGSLGAFGRRRVPRPGPLRREVIRKTHRRGGIPHFQGTMAWVCHGGVPPWARGIPGIGLILGHWDDSRLWTGKQKDPSFVAIAAC